LLSRKKTIEKTLDFFWKKRVDFFGKKIRLFFVVLPFILQIMKKSYFDIVVKNLLKHKNKLIDIDKVKDIVSNIMDSDYSENKAYKIIYQLKNR
jgi:hypothetical protein